MKKNYLLIFALIIALLCSACAAGNSAPSSAAENDYSSTPSVREPAPPSADYEAESGAAMEDGGDYWDGEYSTNGESYLVIDENRARPTDQESLITFSLKVDTASYTNVARYLDSGNLPPADAVRTEELINYFNYDAPMPITDGPFAIYTEVGPSPFDSGKHMAFVRVKTEDIDRSELPSSNLTFLIDTSGSMYSHDKLPLLKDAFSLLVETLDEDDIVSIVTYAGSSEVALDSVNGGQKDKILEAIHSLSASGSTAGADGIRTAYDLAQKNYMAGGNNRVILATDGDFNVGINSVDDLADFIAEKKDTGLYLSVLGFGTGNIRDDIMETLSKNGNGNYSYINNLSTAQKVLVDEMGANLFTVADDVKAQIEFNPANVKSYRLIGYENRRLNNEDFEDDTKDAGEIGVGTDVVMMFELELAGSGNQNLKYGNTAVVEPDPDGEYGDELFEVRIRYKDPGKAESKLILRPVSADNITTDNSSDYQFACSVAAFGHLLRNSQYAKNITATNVYVTAADSIGADQGGYRSEFLGLVEAYQHLAG